MPSLYSTTPKNSKQNVHLDVVMILYNDKSSIDVVRLREVSRSTRVTLFAHCNAMTSASKAESFEAKGRLFLVPVSPSVHFGGSKIATFFSERAISEPHLFERAVL